MAQKRRGRQLPAQHDHVDRRWQLFERAARRGDETGGVGRFLPVGQPRLRANTAGAAPALVTYVTGMHHIYFASWYSSSTLMFQIASLSDRPEAIASTAALAVSIEWSWLL